MTSGALKNFEHYFRLGWYQLFILLLWQTSTIGSLINMAFMMFGGIKPKIDCPEFSLKPSFESPDLCGFIANGNCSRVNISADFVSINLEWNLICDQAKIVYFATSIQMAGVLVGAPLFGQLSDAFGRKWVLCVSWVAVNTLGIATAFSPNWLIFSIIRFFLGIACGGLITVWFVFASEIIPHRHRVWIFGIAGWPPCYVFLAWLAYMTEDWRTLSWVANVIPLPALVLCVLVAHESPRWLLYKNKEKQAAQIITKINSWTCRKVDYDELLLTIRQVHNTNVNTKAKKYSFWHLFYTWKLAGYTLTMAFMWFTTSAVSYGLIFNAGKLAGSIYWNGIFYGCARWVLGWLVSALDVLIKRCGRKILHGIFLGIVAVSCAAVFLVLLFDQETYLTISQDQIVRYLNLAAAVCISPIWVIVYLLSAELYPTPIRNLANSFSSLFARIGGILAPQFLYLSDYWPPAVFLIFALLLISDWIAFYIVIPETKGQPLPEEMPEKSIGRSKADSRASAGSTVRSNSFQVYKFTRVNE